MKNAIDVGGMEYRILSLFLEVEKWPRSVALIVMLLWGVICMRKAIVTFYGGAV